MAQQFNFSINVKLEGGYVRVYNCSRHVELFSSRRASVYLSTHKNGVYLRVWHRMMKYGPYLVSQNIARVRTTAIGDKRKVLLALRHPSDTIVVINDAADVGRFLLALYTVQPSLQLIKVEYVEPPSPWLMKKLEGECIFSTISLHIKTMQVFNIPMEDYEYDHRMDNSTVLFQVDKAGFTEFPSNLEKLHSLTELILTHNDFRFCNNWAFLNNPYLQKRLRLLDLSYNKISFVPPAITCLEGLVSLKLGHNWISVFPHTLLCMKKLRYLTVEDNCIMSYPNRMFENKQLSVVFIGNPHHFSDIPFHALQKLRQVNPIEDRLKYGVNSLKELTSRAIINMGLEYKNFGLPPSLVYHLNGPRTCCQCNGPCFNEYYFFMSTFYYNHVIQNVLQHLEVCSTSCLLEFYDFLEAFSQTTVKYVQ